MVALMNAYEQNDPAERGFVGFRTKPSGHHVGTEAELRSRIAEADEVLKTHPRDDLPT